MTQFVGIPLSIDRNGATLENERGELEQAIDSLLELIVFTPKGRFDGDPEFGFEYWNHEFTNLNVREFNNSYLGFMGIEEKPSEINRKDCERSLRESIEEYEPRLRNPEVKVILELNEKIGRRKIQSKYEMTVIIKGAIDDGLGVTRPYEKRISFMVEPIARRI